jgi:hypothetical protein
MKTLYAIVILSLFYAVLRYGIAKDVSLSHWPAYIGQKGLAIAAVGTLVLAIVRRIKGHGDPGQAYKASFMLALSHAMTSVVVLDPQYLGYLYLDGGKLNAWGESAIVLGAVALSAFFGLIIWKSSSLISELGLLFILLAHTFSVGLLKWLDLSRWKYGLVPISLIGCVILIVGIVLSLKYASKLPSSENRR